MRNDHDLFDDDCPLCQTLLAFDSPVAEYDFDGNLLRILKAAGGRRADTAVRFEFDGSSPVEVVLPAGSPARDYLALLDEFFESDCEEIVLNEHGATVALDQPLRDGATIRLLPAKR